MAELSVIIGAEIKDLKKKLQEAEDRLKKFQNQAEKSGKGIDKSFKNTSKSGKVLSEGLKDAAEGVEEFADKTGKGGEALKVLGKVIENMPGKLSGLKEGTTKVAGVLTTLSGEMASTSTASAALGVSIGSAAAAVAVLGAGVGTVLYFNLSLLGLINSTRTLRDATEGLAEATSDYLGKAIAEKSALEQLVSIASDEANSKIVREKAIQSINEKYSKYLGNLDLDSIKTDKVTQSIKNLTLSLIQNAKVKGIEALIAEKSKEASKGIAEADYEQTLAKKALVAQVDKEIKSSYALGNAIDAQTGIKLKDIKNDNERIKAYRRLVLSETAVGVQASKSASGVADLITKFNEAQSETKKLNKEFENTIAPLVELSEEFKKGDFILKGGINTTDDSEVVITASLKNIEKKREAAGAREEAKAKKLAQDIAAQKIKLENEVFKIEQENLTQLEKDVASFGDSLGNVTSGLDDDLSLEIEIAFKGIQENINKIKELQRLADSIGVEVKLEGNTNAELDVVTQKLLILKRIKDLINTDDLNFKVNLDADLEAFDSLLAKLKQIDTVSGVYSDAVSGAFSGMASDISSSLGTGIGAIDGFINSLVGSLAKLAAEMVASAITEKAVASQKIATNTAVATSAAIAGGAESGAATGPGAIFSIPVMIAALVAVVGAAFASIGGFAKGGFSGDNQLAFLNRNELILRPQEQAGLYNAIRGKNLGSLANNTTANSLTDGIVGEVILRGNTQVIQLKRAEKRMSRYYNS